MATLSPSRLTLEDAAALFVADPLGMVLFEYPWGEPGTALEAFDGPDRWQVEVLNGSVPPSMTRHSRAPSASPLAPGMALARAR
jgi:hypothetical protein